MVEEKKPEWMKVNWLWKYNFQITTKLGNVSSNQTYCYKDRLLEEVLLCCCIFLDFLGSRSLKLSLV